MTQRARMTALIVCLLVAPLAACVQVSFSPIPGVSIGVPVGGGGGGGFGNPAMQVGAPGWLVGIWAPEIGGCGLGQDVLYDANGDYRSVDRFGRWYLIDTTLTVRAASNLASEVGGIRGLPAQPVPGQAAPSQPTFGPQEETTWQIVGAEQNRLVLQAADGFVSTWTRCAGASQVTGF